MKLLIEARPLIQAQRSGVAQFIYSLSEAMFEQAPDDEFIVWAPNQRTNPFLPHPNVEFRGKRFFHAPRSILEKVWKVAPLWGIPADIDVYALPYPVLPARRVSRRTRLAVAIYDIAYARYPEVISSPAQLEYLKQCFPAQAAQADKILTISQHTKTDLIEVLNVLPDKVAVVYPGTDLQPPDSRDDASWLREKTARNIPERYLLAVGTLEPRKNLALLFQVAHQLRDRLCETNTFICLAGGSGWNHEATDKLLDELGISDRVIRLGYLPRELLPHLYAHALAFVFPSLYEGFGLPVLEALTCGAPVIASNASALPEVTGEAALLIDPHSSAELAAAIAKLLDDTTLRNRLREAGFVQARNFSWGKAARETLDVYRTLAHSAPV
jgi:glycosyltransferase involved in cell wall biosynthesis